MRVNVYAEEITEEVEIVETTADTGSKFIGVRFYLKTHPDQLRPVHPDDDKAGVTFWVKSSKEGYRKGDAMQLRRILSAALDKLRERDKDES